MRSTHRWFKFLPDGPDGEEFRIGLQKTQARIGLVLVEIKSPSWNNEWKTFPAGSTLHQVALDLLALHALGAFDNSTLEEE
jgi:hypothetical protein